MDLEEARDAIRSVDERMAALFVERMEAARAVAAYKRERGLPIEDKAQEARVIAGRSKLVADEDLRSFYVQFLQDTMEVSKRWQHRLMEGLQVAYCGMKGAFAHIAATRIFPEATTKAYPSFEDTYEAVVQGACDLAVLPIENSSSGEVGQVLNLMYMGPLYVTGVYELPDPSLAAITSDETDALYGLETRVHSIYEDLSSTTRFAVFSRVEGQPHSAAEGGGFILVFTCKDEAGALAKAVNVIGTYGFNMRVLRSRPMSGLTWHYYFYAEIDGDDTSSDGHHMIAALTDVCPHVKVVGRYERTNNTLLTN